MTGAIDTADLRRILDRAREAYANLPNPSSGEDWAMWRLRFSEARIRVERLVADEKGRLTGSGDTLRLTLAGISTSCTSGHAGLLHNWISRATATLAERADA